MPKTPSTSPAGYCTGAEALVYCDAGRVGALVSDTGIPVAALDLPADPIWNEFLLAASGDLELAVQAGRKYTVEDLQALMDGGGAGAAKVREVVAHLAFGKLRRRRGFSEDDDQGYFKAAMETLELLRKGERILPFLETARAGVPGVTEETRAERLARGDVTVVYDRFFGLRARDRRAAGYLNDGGWYE